MDVKLPRQCCRPGCARAAVATLTFVYAESTAVVGPLASAAEPHSWDLCDDHARRITVPRGWEMMRSEHGFSAPVAEDCELTALAEAVREVGGAETVGPSETIAEHVDDEDLAPGRHRVVRSDTGNSRPGNRPRPGRRGHLRVLPDPVD